MIIIIIILTNVISPLHPKLHGMDCTPGPASWTRSPCSLSSPRLSSQWLAARCLDLQLPAVIVAGLGSQQVWKLNELLPLVVLGPSVGPSGTRTMLTSDPFHTCGDIFG